MGNGQGCQEGGMSFWEHVDELRSSLFRIIWVTLCCSVAAFIFKDEVFALVLAPKDSSFVTYGWLDALSGGMTSGMPHFSVRLISTGLTSQFMVHVKMAVYVGVLCASPYILYILFRFVSPALYAGERKYVLRVVGCGYLMFVLGVLACYYLIFPLTFRFLGTYQVSSEVENMISLQSYVSTLVGMSLTLGIVFEMPVLCWLLAKLGFLSSGFMRRVRRHAIVAILIVAAVITPTSDVFTLLLVALPMCLLYEASIFIVGWSRR